MPQEPSEKSDNIYYYKFLFSIIMFIIRSIPTSVFVFIS